MKPIALAQPGIYRITDTKTGRFYVGSSVNVAKRWAQHRARLALGTHPNPILQAIWSSDQTRLVIELIESVERTRDALLQAEQKHLDVAGVGENRMCMNVLAVAGSHLGRRRGELTRLRLAAANIGKRHTPETRAKQRAAKLGQRLPEEHRRKLADQLRRVRPLQRPGGLRRDVRKHSDEQVRSLRAMKTSGMSYSQIEGITGVSRGGLQKIINRDTYRDVV